VGAFFRYTQIHTILCALLIYQLFRKCDAPDALDAFHPPYGFYQRRVGGLRRVPPPPLVASSPAQSAETHELHGRRRVRRVRRFLASFFFAAVAAPTPVSGNHVHEDEPDRQTTVVLFQLVILGIFMLGLGNA